LFGVGKKFLFKDRSLAQLEQWRSGVLESEMCAALEN
jgi:hypothetical protein